MLELQQESAANAPVKKLTITSKAQYILLFFLPDFCIT